jgi:hypothetical protein
MSFPDVLLTLNAMPPAPEKETRFNCDDRYVPNPNDAPVDKNAPVLVDDVDVPDANDILAALDAGPTIRKSALEPDPYIVIWPDSADVVGGAPFIPSFLFVLSHTKFALAPKAPELLN